MSDSIRLTRIDKFFGGMTSNDKDASPGVCKNIFGIDIFSHRDYIQPARDMSTDTLPADTSSRIWGYDVDSSGNLYAITSNSDDSHVKIIKLASAGAANPGAWTNFYVGTEDYFGERNNIVYNQADDGTEYLYYEEGGELISLGDIGEVGFQDTFAIDTSDSDPGNGVIKFNNASPASVTAIYIDLLDAVGADKTAFLDAIDLGSVKISRHNDATQYALYSISARTSASGYRKFTVSYVEGSGTFDTTAANARVVFMAATDLGALAEASSSGYNGRLPMERVQGEVYVGDGQHIVKVDGSNVMIAQAFTLPSGWKCVDFTPYDDSIIILASHSADWNTGFEPVHNTSKLYFWDMTQTTGVDHEITLSYGGPLSVINHDDIVRIFCGQNNLLNILELQSLSPVRTHKIDYISSNNALIGNYGRVVEPESLYVNDGILYFSLARGPAAAESGVYALGRVTSSDPLALAQIYKPPTNAHPSGGMYTHAATCHGDNIFMSCSYYHLDSSTVVTITRRLEGQNSPNYMSDCRYESIYVDAGNPEAPKEWLGFILHAKSMPTGCSVTVNPTVDEGTILETTTLNSTNAQYLSGETDARYWKREWTGVIGKSVKVLVVLNSNTTTYPQIYGITLISREVPFL